MRLRSIVTPGLLRLSAGLLMGCNAIAGIGAPVLEASDSGVFQPGVDGGNTLPDANEPAPDANPPDDGGANVDANEPDGDIVDANVPDTFTPPPPAGKPGFDVTVGGTSGKSANFHLVAAVGESPGGNNVGGSKNYVLKAGVIAVTQPN